jgi:hypothetical protein
VVLAHLAAHVGDNGMTIAQPNNEAGVRQDVADDTVHFDHFLFSHVMSAAVDRCAGRLSAFSNRTQIGRGELAVVAALDVEGDLLILRERGQTRTLDGGYVHEHILRAIIGLDEAEAFGGIKKLHGASNHRILPSRASPAHEGKRASKQAMGEDRKWPRTDTAEETHIAFDVTSMRAILCNR